MADFKINNLSYTDKDFDSIYEELLEIGDEISAKWKPSATNESDPGIVLIKENAIVGDKINYNIDKNILEAFPSMVTQEGVARKLFEEQLACPPNWYKAASGKVNFRYIGTDNQTIEGLYDAYATIPQWTTIRDNDSSVTYTIIDHDKSITFNGQVNEYGYNVLQGTPNEYIYGGTNNITYGALKNNRLYFQEYNVAQNGVFIANANDEYNYWTRVDLLSTQEYGSLVYRFGVDKNQCYIEFPSWASEIIKNGIVIHYITTKGEEGNVANNILSKFANDVTVIPTDGTTVFDAITLNADNVLMKNASSITNGANPDTIEQMYNNFKKVAGTFNTLVTLRDYNSKIRDMKEEVSNGFACDRTNNLQSSYNIVHTQGDYTRRLKKQENTINPCTLKLYMTQSVSSINSPSAYNNSFNFVDNFGAESFSNETFNEAMSNDVYEVIDELEENKCMSYDFDVVKRYKPLFFKNKYPINCSIIPRYKLTDEQLFVVKNNVINALYNLLKADNVEFGKSIDYDEVYNTILNADNRIGAISLDDIQYTTYAVYRGSRISKTEDGSEFITDKYFEVPVNSIYEKNYVSAVDAPGEVFVGTYNESDQAFTPMGGSPISSGSPFDEYVNLNSTDDFDKYIVPVDEVFAMLAIDKYKGVDFTSVFNYPFGTKFATDIYAKSVLNGNTPIVEIDDTFNRSVKQKEKATYKANYITTTSNITLGSNSNPNPIGANESVQVFTPRYETSITFASGCKMSYNLNNNILPNVDYVLGSGEYVYIFRQLEGETDYQWKKYVEGDVLRVNKTLYSANSCQASATIYDMTAGAKCGPDLTTILVGTMGTTTNVNFVSPVDIALYSPSSVTYTISSLTDLLKKCSIYSQDSLMAKDTIEIRRKVIKDDLDRNYIYFWVLNNSSIDSNYPSGYKCVLFNTNETERVLLDGESFFYANADGSAIGTLGAGTKITRPSTWTSEWACDKINILDFYDYTTKERANLWQKVVGSNALTAEEQNITSFGEGSKVWLSSGSLSLTNTLQSLDGYTINYLSQDGEQSIITLSTPSGSSIRSALQLIASDTQPQKLESHQSITIDGANTISNCYVMTDRDCDYNGTNVDVRLVTLSNDYVPLSIMKYEAIANADIVGDYVFNSNGGITFTLDNNTSSFTTSFEKGNYLLPFRYIDGTNSPSFTISFDGGTTSSTLTSIGGSTTFEENTMYYLDIGVDDSSEFQDAIITISGDDGQIIDIGGLSKYSMPEALKQDEDHTYNGKSYYWYVIMQRIKELDTLNEFDYGYKILDSERIDNPLDPISFNNPAHIMNQFTICQMDTEAMQRGNISMGSIRILNNVRSS